MNYSEKELKLQAILNALTHDTLLKISFDMNSKILDDLIHLPAPLKHDYANNRLVLIWAITGFFDTRKSIEFLNDLIARIKLSYGDSRLISKRKIKRTNEIKAIRLREFAQNKFIKSRVSTNVAKITRHDCANDRVFVCLKVYAEALCVESSFFTFEDLHIYAKEHFIDDSKDRSTLRAKCRSIWHWYNERDFQATNYTKKDKELVMATRVEQAEKMRKKLMNDTRNKVLNIINGLFADEYKKKNGKWNITKIASASGTHRDTVSKYLKETQQC